MPKPKVFRRGVHFREGSVVECNDGSIYIVGSDDRIVGVVWEAQQAYGYDTTNYVFHFHLPLRKIGEIEP